MCRTLAVALFGLTLIILLGGPLLLYAVLTDNTDLLYYAGLLGVRMALWVGGVRIDVHGQEKIPAGRARVFMPNHQSYADPPSVFAHLPPVFILAKKEFFRIPILGQAMRLRGFIPVDRSNREQRYRSGAQGGPFIEGGKFLSGVPGRNAQPPMGGCSRSRRAAS